MKVVVEREFAGRKISLTTGEIAKQAAGSVLVQFGDTVVFVAAQNGNVDPDKTMQLIRGMKLDSPRGPIMIDPATRDIVQTIYIRRVDKVGGKYQNTEIASYPNVRDPIEK